MTNHKNNRSRDHPARGRHDPFPLRHPAQLLRLRAAPFWPDLTGKPTMMQMVERAATVNGLTDVDLNFPDHVAGEPEALARRIGDLGLSINGLAMRYYTNPAFKLGAFTNPDEIREAGGHRADQARHRRGARHGHRPHDDLARPGRIRLRFPAGLWPGLGLGNCRHPRRCRT